MFEKKIFEIPLSHEMERRHLSAVVGIMVFLLTVLLILSFQIGGSFFAWQDSMMHKLTIKIPQKNINLLEQTPVLEKEQEEEAQNLDEKTPADDEKESEKKDMLPSLVKKVTVDELYEKVCDLLKKTPAVIQFKKTNNNIEGPLYFKQWFFKVETVDSLDIPLTIDVDFKKDNSFDIKNFLNALNDIHPKIHIDYNERLQEMLYVLGNVLKVFSALLIVVVTICLILLMTLVTRSSLKAHSSIIDVLRLLGAKNKYIVNIYQFQAFRSVLFGAFLGAMIGIALMYCLKFGVDYFGYSGFSFELFNIQTLQIFLLIPLIVAFLALFSARIVVKKELRALNAS
ncbi:MAG: FtsX-like permease family protein [Proteobacteria bacterium]|nr:FtsX-like permease family protein [Pseudomonadota bacterium]